MGWGCMQAWVQILTLAFAHSVVWPSIDNTFALLRSHFLRCNGAHRRLAKVM